jgi:Zn-dependent protease with chaperone function
MLKSAGRGQPLAVRLQQQWRWVAVSLFLLIAVMLVCYRWGLPWAAEKLAFHLPEKALSLIGKQAFSMLDGKLLEPSALPPPRQQELRERFTKVAFPSEQCVATNIQFRSGKFFGANAFALPDGTIVFLDALVQLAENDDQLVAVFAHEAGHVSHRHGIRQIIQNSAVALVVAAYIGDVSSLGGAIAGWTIEAKYSRDFERDADRFAAVALKHNRLSPRLLGSFLMKLENEHRKNIGASGHNEQRDYFSTHPATAERIKELEALSN